MSKTAWLIAGGAFKGAFDIPILEHLVAEHGLPDVIGGVSVGAINGSMTAVGKLETLRKIWEAIDDESFLLGVKGFMRPAFFRNKGFYSLKPTQRLLRKHLKAEDLRCLFQPGWTSRNGGFYDQPTFDGTSNTNRLHRHILASAAMTPFHEPWIVRKGGRDHIGTDGGHIHVLPQVPWDVTNVIAIFHVSPGIEERAISEVNGRMEAIKWAISIQMTAQARADYAELQYWAGHGQNSATVYIPGESLGSMFDAKRETIRKRMDIGVEAIDNPVTL
jgi:hypothetical protein